MAFETEQIRLSMRSPETAKYLTANVYTVDGIVGEDGLPRQLSIGQLVMAVCFERAAKTEAAIVQIMKEMNDASEVLETITKIEDALVNAVAKQGSFTTFNCDDFSDIGLTASDFKDKDGNPYSGSCWDTYLNNRFGFGLNTTQNKSQEQIDEWLSGMETKMDQYNTINQQKMIELQSQTNKRDQSYDLMSAMLKSFGTTLTGIVNNY